MSGRHPRIATTYEVVTPESAEEGDAADRGWVDEEGDEIELDEYDVENDVTLAEKAAQWLEKHGATEASSTAFHKGLWYTGDYSTNYRTGAETSHSFHLKGFTEAQEREIYNEVFPGRRHGSKRDVRRPSADFKRPGGAQKVVSYHGRGKGALKRSMTLAEYALVVKTLRKNKRLVHRAVLERWWSAGYSPEEAAKGIA